MVDHDYILRVGTILTITTGSYSDYRDHGPFRVLKDFDKHEVADAFRKQWKPPEPVLDWESPTGGEFIAWLATSDYIEDVAGAQSWHVGDYDFEPVF